MLIHYCAHYNNKSGKCEYSTDETGNPKITGDYLMLDDAEIVFENGVNAAKSYLKPGIPVLVESDYTLESYPCQMHCTKIVILK